MSGRRAPGEGLDEERARHLDRVVAGLPRTISARSARRLARMFETEADAGL